MRGSIFSLLYDPTYILVIIGAVISMLASFNVKASFNKYSKVGNSRGLSGHMVAEQILRLSGITDVRVERVSGSLTDHYSPNEKVLRLSESVYDSVSVAAIGVAAHECGHAVQHHENYAPLGLRSMAVPISNIGSKLSWPVILIGLAIGYTPLAKLGVLLFLFVVFFQLITLPVEFDASGRAMKILSQNNILQASELKCAGKVLTAAALTYVAALFSTILQLLRLVMIVNGNSRRRSR